MRNTRRSWLRTRASKACRSPPRTRSIRHKSSSAAFWGFLPSEASVTTTDGIGAGEKKIQSWTGNRKGRRSELAISRKYGSEIVICITATAPSRTHSLRNQIRAIEQVNGARRKLKLARPVPSGGRRPYAVRHGRGGRGPP